VYNKLDPLGGLGVLPLPFMVRHVG